MIGVRRYLKKSKNIKIMSYKQGVTGSNPVSPTKKGITEM
jgi:hypothetical protein